MAVLKKMIKAGRAFRTPEYWRALTAGVVPTIEHGAGLLDVMPTQVIDVGANKGQFSAFAAARWPQASLFAFEPIPDQARRFRRVLGNRAKLFECALGAAAGEADMHIASRADSSSLLPLAEQKKIFSMEERSTVTVPVRRLDEVLHITKLAGPTLLKIDVQGFEYEVLQGATELLPAIKWIFVEVSFVELYEGQRLYPEIARLLDTLGYDFVRRTGGFNDAEGKEIQADILFVRREGGRAN